MTPKDFTENVNPFAPCVRAAIAREAAKQGKPAPDAPAMRDEAKRGLTEPLVLSVRPAPKNTNRKRGRHWAVSKRERDRIGREVAAQVWLWRRHHDPIAPPVVIELYRVGWNRMDVTGVIESAKPVIDALVKLRVLPDDGPRYIPQAPVVTQQIGRRGWCSELRVTVREL